MLNIFKRKKRAQNSEPEQRPIEEEISLLLNKYTGVRTGVGKSDFLQLSKELKNIDNGDVYSICSTYDQYPLTIFIRKKLASPGEFIKELNELTRMEVLQYPFSGEFYEEGLWSVSGSEIFTNENLDYFITIGDFQRESSETDSIDISHSREFAFGQLLISDLYINKSPVSISYTKLLFSENTIDREYNSFFQSTLLIDKKEIRIFYMMTGNSKITSALTKALIKEQKITLEKALKVEVTIKNAGVAETEEIKSFSGYTMTGKIHTTGADIPYSLLFPRKLINLFPDYICSTIKGKILQINKELFRAGFPAFYRPMNHFLMADFLSVVEERDLNLICQNFFVANSIHGDDIRKLFFYKVKLEEKSRIQREPFISAEKFINHLPLRLKEEFRQSKSYSRSHSELLEENQQMLDRIYRQISGGKLLLSYKSQFILHKESGVREKESKALRLRKLIGDKRYINHLGSMDSKKVQILLSTMKNVLIVDTFIYQTDELVKLKPFLSRNRFNELKEDISYTQGKIKSNQIDINRICDSIGKFNLFIREFVEKEQKKEI
jgi:hypothetical protein